MPKSKRISMSITLVSMLLLVFSIQCTAVYAQHYGAANFYTTNWFIPDGETTWQDRLGGHEKQNVQWAFSQIGGLMQQQTYYYYYYWYSEPVYASIQNHGDQTNKWLVKNQIHHSRSQNWWSTDLYVGHKAVDTPDPLFTEGFESWNNNSWGMAGSIWIEQANPHRGTRNAKASVSSPGAQGSIWTSISPSSIVYMQAYVKFLSLNVPQGGRVELLALQGNNWENSVVAAITNPDGTPVWTLITTVNGNMDFKYDPASDRPVTGYYYNVQLTRDLSNGQAKLYVTKNKAISGPGHNEIRSDYMTLEASQNRYMTTATNIVGAGICWQSSSGYNLVTVDSIIVKSGNNNYGFIGNVHPDFRWDPSYPTNHPEVLTWDYDIYDQTRHGSRERFAFMWVCQNADVEGSNNPNVHGPAYAWSNGAIYNDGYNDGYRHPTGANYVFIGWQDTNPWLTSYMGTFGPYGGSGGTPNIFKYFLVFFYYYALRGYDWYNVNQALDLASRITGYYNFDRATFAYPNSGYWTYWPWPEQGPTYAQGFMRVYGNGDIYLPQSQVYYWW